MNRRLRRFLAGEVVSAVPNLDRQRHSFDTAYWHVRLYYAFTLYFAYIQMVTVWRIAEHVTAIDPLWPVWWVRDVRSAGAFILLLFMGAALLGVLLPQYRAVRALVFLAMLESIAYRFSFGAINHSLHFWLWVGFCFCFLPSGNRTRLRATLSTRHRYLLVFWATLALIALFYSLSGFWKVASAIHDIIQGRQHAFSPTALASVSARLMLESGQESLLGPFLVTHPWLGLPANVWMIYVQLAAFIVAFRPALHKLWGVMLIVFHVGTYLLLNINFPLHMLVLTLLFVWSPFAPAFDWRKTASCLPIFGIWLSRLAILTPRQKVWSDK